LESSDIEVTAMSLRALQAYAPKAQKPKYEQAVRLAKSWLEAAQPRSTEDRAFQLLGFVWVGTARELRTQVGRALLTEQRPDGGWGQIPSLPSDAYATGQAMVALRENGVVHAAAPHYQRGVRFLLNTQFEDGSWYVRSRAIPFQPYFESGFPYGDDQWISAAATNWASMALLLALK
jgi:squalene cyclase